MMIKNKEGKKLTGKQLLDVLNQIIVQDSIIISDEFKGYNIISKKTTHLHFRVDHTKEFVSKDQSTYQQYRELLGNFKAWYTWNLSPRIRSAPSKVR